MTIASTSSSGDAGSRQAKDYASDQSVRWCPGCGDFSVLASIKRVLSNRKADPDKTVFVSGIGCSSRLPYYLSTYGIHAIHGRAPAIASGLRVARPDLDVWVVTGDGDALAIGGNHLLHAIRRNLSLKIIILNNRIYGLTKGQISPTSEQRQVTVSTPFGSLGTQISPCAFAVGCEATFVARTMDILPRHMEQTLERAANHKGIAVVEVYQNCRIFNNGAFAYAADAAMREDNIVEMEHGKALIFGKNLDKGIRLASGYRAEVVNMSEQGISLNELLIHDERAPSPALAFLLGRLRHPEFPEPIGVFRAVEVPSYDIMLNEEIDHLTTDAGESDLSTVLKGTDSWTIES